MIAILGIDREGNGRVDSWNNRIKGYRKRYGLTLPAMNLPYCKLTEIGLGNWGADPTWCTPAWLSACMLRQDQV